MTNAHPPEGDEPVPPAVAVDPSAEVAADPTPPDVAVEVAPPVDPVAPDPEPAPEPVVDVPVPITEAPVEAAVEPAETPAAAPEAPVELISPLQLVEQIKASFETLGAELAALATKVAANELPFKQANAELDRIRAAIAAGPAVGVPEELSNRIGAVEVALKAAGEAHRAARAAAAEVARATKDRIVAEAETIAAGTQWRVGGDRLTALLDEWKSCARLDRKSDDELWKRFSAARSAFAKRRKVHYHELAHDRDAARKTKEELAEQAEALATSTDFAATAATFRDLMTQWKSSGRAGREVDDALWARFRAAQDAFFATRNAAMGARDNEQSANLAAKEELAVQAEALLPVTDLKSARAALRSIQERWEAIGHVPREAKNAIEARLAAVETAVRGADGGSGGGGGGGARPGANPAARARAQETVDALLASIAASEAKAAKAEAAGDSKRAKEATEAAAARREWLVEAEKTLAEFS
ncbi:MAG TPA: DUF349 domain-containing protein [Sporichthyaceae bacterium]